MDHLTSSTGFLRGIAFDARENDVRLAIANALHGGSFDDFGPEKINFDLQLHRNKRGGGNSHGGTGKYSFALLQYQSMLIVPRNLLKDH